MITYSVKVIAFEAGKSDWILYLNSGTLYLRFTHNLYGHYYLYLSVYIDRRLAISISQLFNSHVPKPPLPEVVYAEK